MWLSQVSYSDDLADALELPEAKSGFTTSGGIGELILLIFIFVLIIAACYYVTKFIGGKQLTQMKHSNFTVLDTYRITQNKFLQLIRMGKQYVVIAVTKDTVSVIAHLTEEEVIKPENKPNEAASFKHILSDMVHKKKSDEKVDMK